VDGVIGDSESMDPLRQENNYHHATVKRNKRITAHDWYQDVRHLELVFDEHVRYSPGDVAVIHPRPDAEDVETFLEAFNYSNEQQYTIKHTMTGK
jgi:sulfite reductase alpha subunit-like flavoprotein